MPSAGHAPCAALGCLPGRPPAQRGSCGRAGCTAARRSSRRWPPGPHSCHWQWPRALHTQQRREADQGCSLKVHTCSKLLLSSSPPGKGHTWHCTALTPSFQDVESLSGLRPSRCAWYRPHPSCALGRRGWAPGQPQQQLQLRHLQPNAHVPGPTESHQAAPGARHSGRAEWRGAEVHSAWATSTIRHRTGTTVW